jgi:hypothetical protein
VVEEKEYRAIFKGLINCIPLEDYRLIVERKPARPSDEDSYADGSVSSWQGHQCQTECSSWSFRYGVGREANDPTPEEFRVTKPPVNLWKRTLEIKTRTGL